MVASNPAVTGLNPASALGGGSGFTLTITGSNFVPGATVRWNGSPRSTTFVSGTQLTATISAADLATVGTVSVTVANPGGGTSEAQPFTVSPAADLAVGITDSSDPRHPNKTVTYTVIVTNRGPSTATGVLLNDTVSDDAKILSVSANQGTCSQT